MKITFWGETRTTFSVPSNDPSVPSLGSFGASEILLNEVWQQSSTCVAQFVAPEAWVQNNLFPGRNPANSNQNYRRARYFTIRKPDESLSTFVLENFEADEIGDETVMVKVTGSDPRIFFETMSSSPSISGENWVATRLQISQMLTSRVSNSSAYGMEAWQRLPILPLDSNYSPTAKEQKMGIKKPSEVAPSGNIEIGIPDPLPIKPSVDDLHSEWNYAELFPIEVFGQDGTDSPFWRWGIRTKTSIDHIFSKSNGDLKIEKYAGTWADTETLAYSSTDQTKFSYATGKTSSRARLKGPWAGIKTTSVSPPEGAEINAFLRSKANTGTMNAERLAIQTTINFSKAGVNAYAGTFVNVRIGSKIYLAEAKEITSHYSAENGGWAITSPVFISMDSIDLSDPIDPINDITIVVNGSNFTVPSFSPSGAYFNWRIYADGRSIGIYSGSANPSGTGGFLVEFGEAGTHQLTIQPADGNYSAGWARAFAFNGRGDRGKLISVISDPDHAHLASETETGDYFRAGEFFGCINLTTPVPEAMPNTVRSIGNEAFAQMYEGTRIDHAPSEYVSENAAGAIGNGFRRRQYANITTITSSAIESMSTAITSVGDHYRSQQYIDSRVTSAPDESPNEQFKVIGDYFRANRFAGSRIVQTASEAGLSLTAHGTYYRYREYYQCAQLTTAKPEALVYCAQLGDYFRYQRFYQCTQLITPANESIGNSRAGDNFRTQEYALSGVTSTAVEDYSSNSPEIPPRFRRQQYQYCSRLVTISSPEAVPENVLSIGVSYRQNQFNQCTSLAAGQVQGDYSNVETIENAFCSNQYARCSSLNLLPEEPDFNSLLSIGNTFMQQRFEYVGTGIAPNEGAMPLLESVGNSFRLWNYRDSKVTEIGREANMPSLISSGTGFRSYMYLNCPNIVNAKKYPEGQTPLRMEMGNNRTQQFANSGIVYPLAEGDANGSEVAWFQSSGGYRNEQYYNCINLQEVPAENQVSASTTSPNFRMRQFFGCVSIVAAGQNKIFKHPNPNPNSGGFRKEQFGGTPLKNISGLRINYLDGTEVVEGADDIPNDFYSDV